MSAWERGEQGSAMARQLADPRTCLLLPSHRAAAPAPARSKAVSACAAGERAMNAAGSDQMMGCAEAAGTAEQSRSRHFCFAMLGFLGGMQRSSGVAHLSLCTSLHSRWLQRQTRLLPQVRHANSALTQGWRYRAAAFGMAPTGVAMEIAGERLRGEDSQFCRHGGGGGSGGSTSAAHANRQLTPRPPAPPAVGDSCFVNGKG